MAHKKDLKIGAYIRVSTEEQAKNPEGSIKNQLERIKQAVEFKNLHENFGSLEDVYVDRGKSGKDTNRAELQRLLQDIEAEKINLVAVSELSRISRNIRDFSQIWDLMKEKGCGFYSLRENFDSTNAAGEMVLYSIANIAQFERRQVSERVAANMRSRASRGLYNGGPVPLGYKLIDGKPGFLEVDEQAAETVRACFQAFIQEETLSRAARWLNNNAYFPKRKIQGGSGKSRVARFSTENLYKLLVNKCYIGVKKYKDDGKYKEVKAVWPPIIDEVLFYRVQETLKKNKSKKKPPSKNRYPYLLSGLVYCGHCGDVLCGKSAHGNGGKIGYYEHGWAVRQEACLTKKVFDCGNFKRIGAKKLEPLVIEKIRQLLQSESLALQLLEKTKAIQSENPHQKEMNRLEAKLKGLERQLGALAERLSELPKNISATPVYKHMEKIEYEKKAVLELIERLRIKGGVFKQELPELNEFQLFLDRIGKFIGEGTKPEVRAKAIAALVHRIEVFSDTLKIYFHVKKEDTKKGLPQEGGPSFFVSDKKNLKIGSNNLTNGGDGGS